MKHQLKSLVIVIGVAALVLGTQKVNAQWYVGGGLGYSEQNATSLLHFSPEVGYSFNPHWTVGLGTSFQRIYRTVYNDVQATYINKRFDYWFLNPYVRFTFLNIDKLSFFADATARMDALHGFTLYDLGIRPGISYALNDRFTAVAQIGFIGYYNNNFKAEVGLNSLEFSLYYQFKKRK
jgi:hypothetical protein